jgi:hypothetical protein
VSIRAKLYAAIALTILGPLATTGVALHGMSQMNNRFDEVRERARHEAVARELKFQVTDFNGWQTAYGYANGGPLRARFLRSAASLHGELGTASKVLTDPAERAQLARIGGGFRSFMALDVVAYRSLRNGQLKRTRQIVLGPELRHFGAMADAAENLASYEEGRAAAADRSFNQAKDDARRRLIAAALVAGIVIILLLVTANDVARLALEGERARGKASGGEQRS